MAQGRDLRFIIDANAGKLVGWLRMMGYDTLFFKSCSDSEMVKTAAEEKRIIITRDTHIMERRVAKTGEVQAILLKSDDPAKQLEALFATLDIKVDFKPFSLCIACNHPLVEASRETLKGQVPEYVYKTQDLFCKCPNCGRIYWRGTHWQAMKKLLEKWKALKS